MKIRPLAITIIATALFLMTGCKKEKDDEPETDYFRAFVNGTKWEATKINIQYNLAGTEPRELTGVIGDEKISFRFQNATTGNFIFRLNGQNDMQPATLINFDVEVLPTTHTIKWETSVEVNTSQFIVERSKDGLNWSTVATITAADAAHSYQTSINISGISFGLNTYYRLKVVNSDATFSYSTIRTVPTTYTAYYKPAGQDPSTAIHGSIEITSVDNTNKIIKGQFNFNGTYISTGAPYNITNGEFRVTY